MKSLIQYILESATGMNLSTKGNIDKFVDFLNNHEEYDGLSCIICEDDPSHVLDKLDDWIIKDENLGQAIFFIKVNSGKITLCLYGPVVEDLKSKDELSKYGISFDGSKYRLDGLKQGFDATHKNIKRGDSYLLFDYPKSMKQYIHTNVDGNDGAKTYKDFGRLGAYVIPIDDMGNVFKDISKQISFLLRGYKLHEIFLNDDPAKFIQSLDDNNYNKFKEVAAKVIAEPLSMYYVYKDIANIRKELTKDSKYNGKKITHFLIPISKNWPIVDFYVKFDELPEPVGVSVKQGSNGGNHSSLITCLYDWPFQFDTHPTQKTKESIEGFFKNIIKQFRENNDTSSKNTLKLEFKENIDSIAKFILSNLILAVKQNNKQVKKSLRISFNNIIEHSVNDESLLKQLKEIQKSTNLIEKIYSLVFNNSSCLNDIKRCVAISTECHKITIQNDGKWKMSIHKETAPSFKIKNNAGGKSPIIKFDDNGNIEEVTKNGSKKGNGQWLGYEFK